VVLVVDVVEVVVSYFVVVVEVVEVSFACSGRCEVVVIVFLVVVEVVEVEVKLVMDVD
jgi:hypothetical protein